MSRERRVATAARRFAAPGTSAVSVTNWKGSFVDFDDLLDLVHPAAERQLLQELAERYVSKATTGTLTGGAAERERERALLLDEIVARLDRHTVAARIPRPTHERVAPMLAAWAERRERASEAGDDASAGTREPAW